VKKRWIAAAGGLVLFTGLGTLGGCEIVAIQAMNLIETTEFTVDGSNA